MIVENLNRDNIVDQLKNDMDWLMEIAFSRGDSVYSAQARNAAFELRHWLARHPDFYQTIADYTTLRNGVLTLVNGEKEVQPSDPMQISMFDN